MVDNLEIILTRQKNWMKARRRIEAAKGWRCKQERRRLVDLFSENRGWMLFDEKEQA